LEKKMSIESDLLKMVELLTHINEKLATLVAPGNPVPPVAVPVATQAPAPSPEPAPTQSATPFTDHQGMINYVMAAYKDLGPQKGAGIQDVMATIGLVNINDAKPGDYDALYQGIESLKGA
jgi:hypothetical protein